MNPRPSGPEPDALSTELRALDFLEYNTSCGKWLVNADKFDRLPANPLTDAGSTRPRQRVSGGSRSLRLQTLPKSAK